MIVYRDNVRESFNQVDKKVFVHKGLSDGAKVLYGYLAGLRVGQNYSDTYLIKALAISSKTLARRKKELTDLGLILVKQVRPRVYMLFVGHTRRSATSVMMDWENENDRVDNVIEEVA